MAESSRHRQLKNRDAHGTGKTEVVLASGRRLDALSPTKIATEVERSGSAGIKKSVSTLRKLLIQAWREKLGCACRTAI
jgi:hypothetical protein